MKNFTTVTLTAFIFSSALWIIWSFFVVQIEASPSWLGSYFYLPHAARVLCVVYFGWKAVPGLFLAELWGPNFNILEPQTLTHLIPPLMSVLSVPLALNTLSLFGFPLGSTQSSPLNNRNYKHIALITLISATYNSLLINLTLTRLSLNAIEIGIDQIGRFFVGDIVGTAIVVIALAFTLKPILSEKTQS